MQLLLAYAKYGEMKDLDDEDYSDQRMQSLLAVSENIDAAVNATSGAIMQEQVNLILIAWWDDIREYLDNFEDEDPSKEGSEEGSGSSSVAKNLSENTSGTTASGKGSSSGMSERAVAKAKEESEKTQGKVNHLPPLVRE